MVEVYAATHFSKLRQVGVCNSVEWREVAQDLGFSVSFWSQISTPELCGRQHPNHISLKARTA